jgi:hypothetical protein
MENNELCELCKYNCGKIGIYKLKTDPGWCCSKHHTQCPEHRAKMRKMALDRSPFFQIRENINQGKLRCYICGKIALFLVNNKKPCCKENAMKCSGYSEYVGDIIKAQWNDGRKQPWEGPGSRPKHSKTLLQQNEYGTLGLSGWWHKRARDLFHTGICEMCGKTEEEELRYMGKGLHMHCSDENYTNLKKNNWTVLCHADHMKIHSNAYSSIIENDNEEFEEFLRKKKPEIFELEPSIKKREPFTIEDLDQFSCGEDFEF